MDFKLCTEFPNQLLLKSNEPCISIFMPTHKLIFNNKQDVLVFKNLAKEAKASLEQKYSDKDIKPLLSLFKNMEDNVDLWNNSQDGLGIFATLDEMIIYRLEENFHPMCIVSDSFHIKPLIKYFQAVESFNLLALEAESFTIYKGSYLHIDPIPLSKDVETTLKGILGSQHTEGFQTHGSYGGASDSSVFHGHGGKSDEIELDREKFFRHVDRFVLEEISKKSKLPLILVSHKEHHADFRKLSANPFLLEDRIEKSYHDYKEDEIKDEIKKINDNRFSIVVDQAIEHYHNLTNKELSSDQIIIVLKALLESRVDTLFIEDHKIIPGKIDKENKQIIHSDIDDPETDDLLDDMIEHAMLTGTKVFILDEKTMPTTSGVAATFRY